jgi:hypothetical protein
VPIGNTRELQQVREQIARLRRGLRALENQVKPLNIHNFETLAEGPRDEIKKLEAEVDAYLSRPRST